MNETINTDELVQKIRAAFSDVEYPTDETLVNDSYGEEPGSVKNHFIGHNNWENLTAEFIDFGGALSFLSDKAFRFFLPAFLIADLNQNLDFNDPTVRLCYWLTPQSENEKIAKAWGGATMGERARKCFDMFSKEQVGAIISYLRWRLWKDEINFIIEQALENYWLKRETSFN